MCNTKLNQLEEQREALAKMEEVTVGGIVTGVRTGESKNGKPYGIVKMEDFAGNGEIPLFGTDWITYRNFFTEGTSLFIRLKFEPNRFRPDVFNMNIKGVELMSEMRENAVRKITLDVPLDVLTSQMVADLAEIVKENPGKTDLVFNIHTSDNNKVSLMARRVKLNVNGQLLLYLQEHDGIGISVN